MSEQVTKLLVNAKVAAEMLDISERTLARLTKSGEVPCVRLGSLVKYSVDRIREMIQLKEQTAA